MATDYAEASALPVASGALRHQYVAFALMVAFFVLAPFVVYPLFAECHAKQHCSHTHKAYPYVCISKDLLPGLNSKS